MKSEAAIFDLLIDLMKEYIDHKGRKFQIDKEDKELLYSYAVRNKVLPVLKEELAYINCDLLGDNNKQSTYIRRLYANRFAMIKDVISQFEMKKIKYAIIKGAYLGDTAYNNLSLREVNDIDILIRQEDIKVVKEVCHECGFVLGKSDRINKKIIHYTRKQEIAFTRNTHQIATMVKIDTDEILGFYDTVIDFNFKLSWGEYRGQGIVANEFLEHTKRFEDSNGFIYNVLETPYNLVQLCLHAYKEANGLFFLKLNQGLFLRAFLDIYYYIIRMENELENDVIVKLVQKYNIATYMYFILFIIEELFGRDKRVHALLQAVEEEAEEDIIEQFGLENKKSWKNISVKERFYSRQTVFILQNQISVAENEKVEMAAKEFY